MPVHGLIYFSRATVDLDGEVSSMHYEPLAGGGKHRKILIEVILSHLHNDHQWQI
jgi:ribonuclease BN (tRNA processing enzyme)